MLANREFKGRLLASISRSGCEALPQPENAGSASPRIPLRPKSSAALGALYDGLPDESMGKE